MWQVQHIVYACRIVYVYTGVEFATLVYRVDSSVRVRLLDGVSSPLSLVRRVDQSLPDSSKGLGEGKHPSWD